MSRVKLIHHRFVDNNGLRLHCALAGDDVGAAPPLILLHGFPDHWIGWRAQIQALAADRLVIAPDGRGVNLSDAPKAVLAYGLRQLVGDVIAIADALCPSRPFDLAGHDWGGVVAWSTACLHPGRVRRMAILNAPHPRVLGRALADNPAQRAASAYIDALRADGAETMLAADDHARLLSAFADLPPEFFSPEEAVLHRQAWRRPGRLSGALNWYRAADFLASPERAPYPDAPLDLPILQIWGRHDLAIPLDLAAGSDLVAACAAPIVLDDCGHWPARQRAGDINALLRDHFKATID